MNIGHVEMNIEASDRARPVQSKTQAALKVKTSEIPSSSSSPTPAPPPTEQPSILSKIASGIQTFIPKSNEDIPAQANVPAAPSVRRLARELGVEVSGVPGSGPGGRISKNDVKSFTKQIVLSKIAPTSVISKPIPDFSKFGKFKRDKMSKISKVTKDHMTNC